MPKRCKKDKKSKRAPEMQRQTKKRGAAREGGGRAPKVATRASNTVAHLPDTIVASGSAAPGHARASAAGCLFFFANQRNLSPSDVGNLLTIATKNNHRYFYIHCPSQHYDSMVMRHRRVGAI